MFVRNFLTSGDFMTIVPIGVPITLQYDVSGHLEKVLLGYGDDTRDVSELVKQKFYSNKTVPTKISVVNGTSWVSGVLHTKNYSYITGRIPEDTSLYELDQYALDPSGYSFFAATVSSLSTTFRGAVPIRQWLTLSGFKVLPGYVIPADMNETSFKRIVNQCKDTFPYPLFMGYFIFHLQSVNYHSLGFKKCEVNSIINFIDDDGCVMSRVVFSDSTDKVVSYSDVVYKNIQVSSNMILDESYNIIYVRTDSNKSVIDQTRGEIHCPSCGKIYRVPSSGSCKCPDQHCNSRLFNRTNQFLSCMGLDTISRSRYDEVVTDIGRIYSIPDILDIYEFKDVELDVRLSKLLRSIVPYDVIEGSESFNVFCSKCNNNVNSLTYYLDNPDKAVDDLQLYESPYSYNKFLIWLSDQENVGDIKSLLSHPRIKISESGKALLDVSPIFRGVNIMITGKFRRGDDDRIVAILESYGANVSKKFSNDTSFVVVGSTHDDVNGSAIRHAKSRGKQVFEENEFFSNYEIDEDLVENLK